MYTYNISKSVDKVAFEKACESIRNNLPGTKREHRYVDVDGSQIQLFRVNGATVKVLYDYEVNAVYCDSEVDLQGILD